MNKLEFKNSPLGVRGIFQPFANISRQTVVTMVIAQMLIALVLWHTTSNGLIPKPDKVAGAFMHLLSTKIADG